MYELVPGVLLILVLALFGWMVQDTTIIFMLAVALVFAWLSFVPLVSVARIGWFGTILIFVFIFGYAWRLI